jgi:hypothetical protein
MARKTIDRLGLRLCFIRSVVCKMILFYEAAFSFQLFVDLKALKRLVELRQLSRIIGERAPSLIDGCRRFVLFTQRQIGSR